MRPAVLSERQPSAKRWTDQNGDLLIRNVTAAGAVGGAVVLGAVGGIVGAAVAVVERSRRGRGALLGGVVGGVLGVFLGAVRGWVIGNVAAGTSAMLSSEDAAERAFLDGAGS